MNYRVHAGDALRIIQQPNGKVIATCWMIVIRRVVVERVHSHYYPKITHQLMVDAPVAILWKSGRLVLNHV